jgi:asparagine N-glycosylation enzyme membrane subunit Stt3
MSRFFTKNLDASGRRARGVIGSLVLIAGIIIAGDVLWWVGLIFVVAGLFAIFEAVRGWCFLRACGIRTKL